MSHSRLEPSTGPYYQIEDDFKRAPDVEAASMSTRQGEDLPPPILHLSLKERLKHFTFAWYAMTMSTGGVAFVLSVVPFRFKALTDIGAGIFVFNLALFAVITCIITARFIIHRGTFVHALCNPHEGFFAATFWLTIATMMSNTTAYGIPKCGPWLITALRIAFWIYTACASILAVVYYYVLFSVKKLVITNVLPGWVLPIFPAMLVGTLASALAKTQPQQHVFPILFAGLTFQGLGMLVATFMYGLYFGRLLTSGLPADASRPAMFIAVGPPAFTSLALLGMGSALGSHPAITLPLLSAPLPVVTIQLLALLSAIGLYALACWFFLLALLATFEGIGRNDFHLNWYAYVFPNVGFTIATIKIGQAIGNKGFEIVGTIMAILLTITWVLVMGSHVRALINKKICWPGKDEDAH